MINVSSIETGVIIDGDYSLHYLRNLDEIGASIIGKAVTNTLYVSPNGNNTDGSTWNNAYTTIQGALDVASTDEDDCTLILISPHTTNYDINTAGDPTYTGNYILKGSHRNWTKIKNTHASATSILKFSGKACIFDLNFNLGTGSTNGIIMTHDGWSAINCQFIGSDLTGAATALEVNGGGTTVEYGKMEDCNFGGHVSYMTAIKLDNVAFSRFRFIHIHDCLKAIHIVHANSDLNIFADMDFDDNVTAITIDSGNKNHFSIIHFSGNTTNVTDAVGDHVWEGIYGEFVVTAYPDDFSGITLTADIAANVWGSDVEIRSTATATKPFRIVGYVFQPTVTQWYKVRFSSDGGSTYFDEVMLNSDKQIGLESPPGTEFIYNKGTSITASTKAETGGNDTIDVWLKIQEI